MKPICIYHGHCDDGFGAAWAVRHATGDEFEFYAGVYQSPPPDVAGRGVVMVDFSYKRAVVEKMRETAAWIKIIDHHKSAIEDLRGGVMEESPLLCPIELIFDLARSGAGLAWDVYHPDGPRPGFIDYIEDRDLWRKSLSDGDQFTFALRSYPQDFAVWDRLAADGPARLIEEGKSIHRFFRMQVEDQKKNVRGSSIKGVPCNIVNAPYTFASEVAGEIIGEAMFGACYFQLGSGEWAYSLRSRGEFDVSEIAKAFGGGGHKNAAGFKVRSPVHTGSS